MLIIQSSEKQGSSFKFKVCLHTHSKSPMNRLVTDDKLGVREVGAALPITVLMQSFYQMSVKIKRWLLFRMIFLKYLTGICFEFQALKDNVNNKKQTKDHLVNLTTFNLVEKP